MPYCGGVNGGTDYICGGTCYRSGAGNTAQWNVYRTDCSGLVSWAWGVPGPGWTTGTIFNDTSRGGFDEQNATLGRPEP
jgi:hypothetical protein